MAGELPKLLGLVAGLLMFVGVGLGFLLSSASDVLSGHWSALGGTAVTTILDLVFAVLTLFFSAYSASHRPPEKAEGGVVLIVVAALSFYFGGGGWFLLVTVGAILALIAGILFVMESAFRPPPSPPSSH